MGSPHGSPHIEKNEFCGINASARKRMVPQVGLEPHPEIPTVETIVLKILKNTRKTSVDAGFEGVFDLSLKAGKTC
jgi:hypothetical protein